jgi:hypothetical protein
MMTYYANDKLSSQSKEESGSADDNEHVTTFAAAGNIISLWSALLGAKNRVHERIIDGTQQRYNNKGHVGAAS